MPALNSKRMSDIVDDVARIGKALTGKPWRWQYAFFGVLDSRGRRVFHPIFIIHDTYRRGDGEEDPENLGLLEAQARAVLEAPDRLSSRMCGQRPGAIRVPADDVIFSVGSRDWPPLFCEAVAVGVAAVYSGFHPDAMAELSRIVEHPEPNEMARQLLEELADRRKTADANGKIPSA